MFSDEDICPIKGQLACAVPEATAKDSFECVDPSLDVQSCGGKALTRILLVLTMNDVGCVAEGGSGVNCSKLEGVENVQCVKGACEIGDLISSLLC